MKKMPINDLPKYSPWPERLLGLRDFSRNARTVEDMLREYDGDKYAACARYLRAHPSKDIWDVKWFERGGKRGKLCVSFDQNLFETNVVSAYVLREKKFLEKMAPLMRQCDAVVELGAGYGYNLALLQKKYPRHLYAGGELSPKAVSLGKRLLAKKEIAMHPFNFYDDYAIFDSIDARRILVLTYHASEMLPHARTFLKSLAAYKERIVAVAQFEPIYELCAGEQLLDLLRRKYIQANRYNTDLLTALRAHPDVEVRRTHYDVFGTNPLFPESFIEWRFL
jgi:SAM-dependent methyltransferase